MAYKKTGTATSDAVGISDVKSVILSAGSAAAKLTLASDDGTEMILECPANDTKFIVRSGALADRFPCGKNLVATITGDSNTFTRIDG